MPLTRRNFLLTSGSAVVTLRCGAFDGDSEGGAAAPPPSAEPALPSPAGAVDLEAFPSGVQIGDVTADSAILSVHSTDGRIAPTVLRASTDGWQDFVAGDPVETGDGVAQFELRSLHADTPYAVYFSSEDGTRRSELSRFRTALAGGDARPLRIGVTSCLGGNFPWPPLSHAARERLDFFVLLGDTIYADWFGNNGEFELKWREAMARSGMRELTASTSVIATWDDHEIFNNWSWASRGMPETYERALRAFRRALPQRQSPDGSGRLWRSLRWGDAVEIFALDSRSERLDGDYISPDQMRWLKEGLSRSTARFKLVMSSVPIFDFTGTVGESILTSDRWQAFPEQRSELVAHSAAIPGVVFLAGDIHIGAAGRVDPEGGPGWDMWELICGPGGTDVPPVQGLFRTNERHPVVVLENSYTLIEIDPAGGELRAQWINNDGDAVAEHRIVL